MDRFYKDDVYRLIFENSNDAIFLTHPSGYVFRANPAACQMFQRDEEEICRLGRAGVVDINDPRLKPALKERLAKGKIRTELNFRKKDGSIFPGDCTSSLFKDEQGRIWTVIIVRDISLFKQAEDVLRKAREEAMYFASYDGLTGTYNRRAFMDRLQEELSRSERENTYLGLILLDIDYFKKINDAMGHSCGDAVLEKIASCLAEALRPYDILGRYGGDEFIICLPNTAFEEAHKIAERLRLHVEKANIVIDGKHIPVTISLGFSCHDRDKKEDANTLIMRVDKNMYLAKQQRNAVFGL